MSTTDAVRRRLARVLQSLSEGREMSSSELTRARTLIYGFATIAGILKDSELIDLERRITDLEDRP